ncbi:MAG TPA: NADP-dependent oxidoreductase [Candidatus Krumholzibacteria bacterium]|nr:NADP-dependent oxidoreductase [Candidatus Krumholzibacteria bacterium]HRX52804.1 NADP-dependent oxidoreductase [Candidatus Krumholzibacteria bacterium]
MRLLLAVVSLILLVLACAPSDETAEEHGAVMKAIGLYRYGGPEVLGVVEVPKPEPEAGQVRLRVMAAGVNPVDEMVRSGLLASYYEGHPFPYIPGMDVSGVVDALGPDVDPALGLSVGMDVTAMVSNFAGYGGYAEYVCVPAGSVAAMPEGKSYAEAAAYLMPAMTARVALDSLGLPAGSSLEIIGAAGAVGAFACILAERDGLEVTAIASPSDEEWLRSLGVTHFVPRGADADAAVRAIHPQGVDAILDTAGLRERAFPALKDGGSYMALRSWDDAPSVRGIRTGYISVRDRIDDHAAIAEISRLVETGVLPLRVAQVFPSAEAAAAHELQAAKGVRGRVVIEMSRVEGSEAARGE